jgi:DNA helicase-2/ATP-dependent DNA helicase PcrA
VEEFMEKITLMAEVDNHDESQDAVVLMTMHSAKGLEFPVVFLPGMEDGLFPGHKAFDSTTGMEEERRLCYVGMTRAKETLILTSAAMRTLYGRTDYTRESQFLREMDKSLMEGDSVYVRKNRDTGIGVSTGSYDGFRAKESSRPYDALRYAKAATKANASAAGDAAELAVGDRVRHTKFGEGLIIDADDKTLVVIFDTAGQKKMARGIAPLKKI